jgi:hypothetical protein
MNDCENVMYDIALVPLGFVWYCWLASSLGVPFMTALYVARLDEMQGLSTIGSDAIIYGRLSVNEYQNQFIINTTTTNYSLIIAEDLSLNNRLFVSGNISVAGNALNITTTGNLTTTGIITTTGNITTTGTGALVISGLATVTGNITGGNISTAGTLSTTGIITTTGNITTTGTGALVIAGLATVTGNITGGNISTAGTLSTTGTGALTIAGLATVTGNITGGNISTAGTLSTTGTGALTVGGAASISGNLSVTGNLLLNRPVEILTSTASVATAFAVNYSTSNNAVYFLAGVTGNITLTYSNFPAISNTSITSTFVIQGGPYCATVFAGFPTFLSGSTAPALGGGASGNLNVSNGTASISLTGAYLVVQSVSIFNVGGTYYGITNITPYF